MKKTVISAAILLASAGAAQAQLSLYGLLDMSYGKSLYSNLNGLNADFHSGGDNGSSEGNSASRFGLKGSSEVGPGIKANFRLESGGIDSDGGVNGGGSFFARQAWLGFSGGLGEVRLGRQDSVSFQTMIDYDFNGASNGVSALGYTAAAPWWPGRQSRSLQYMSPDIGGVKVHLGIVPKGNRGAGAKSVFSGAVKYASGPLSVSASVQTKDSSTTENFMSVGGSYDFGVAKVMLGYANGGDVADGGSGGGVSAGFVAPVGGINVGVQFAQNSDDLVKSRAVEFFVNSEVFKNTYAYFEVGTWKTSLTVPKDSATGFAAGVIYTF
jgi:predicted porin